MDALQLNAGVSIKNLFSAYTQEQIAKVEEFSVDGFTEDELQQLKDDGIDTDLIKNNAKALDKIENTGTKTDEDVKSKITELKSKYKAVHTSGTDPYSLDNPQLKEFQEALDAGLLNELADAGFTKSQIIDVISGVFDSIGIKNQEGGGYTCPNGHPFQEDSDAVKLYNKFIQELQTVTGEASPEIKAAREKIANISNQIISNNNALKSLEANIMVLQASIEDSIEKAIEKSEKITEEQKSESNSAVSKCLSEYTSSNGKMTYEEFQNKLSGKLDDIAGQKGSELSRAVGEIVSAERKMVTLTGYLNKMSSLISSNQALSKDLSATQDDLSAMLKKQAQDAANGDSCCQRTDPIGFMDGDTRFDFFIDKDSNDKLSNENEFLGAENGFNELKELDTDGDNIVSFEEMKASGVKVVQTNADGTQEIKDISDVLKEGDSIDLNSYEALHADIGNNNILEGTFNLNKDGKNLDGYQTLDSIDWLDNNYDFSDKDDGKGRFAKDIDGQNLEALDFTNKYNIFSQKAQEYRDKLDGLHAKLSFDSTMVKEGISAMATKEANFFAEKIADRFETQAKEEEEKAQEEAEAEKEAKVEEETSESTAGDDVKLDEELLEEELEEN